ncbi:hypothetical protein [Marivita sp.]|nr:hypothetical protein [Marivita sp.]
MEDAPKRSAHDLLTQRILSAAQGISEATLEVVAVQIEALAGKQM